MSRLKEAGMSLTEVMVGGAIMTGVGLGAMTMFKNQNLAQKMIEHEANLLSYHQTLVKIFSQVSNCNATMKVFENKLYVGEAGPPDNIDITSIRLCAAGCDAKTEVTGVTPAGGPGYASVGAWIDNKEIWQIQSIDVPAVTVSAPVRMRVTYQMNPRIPNGKTITKDIIFNVRFDAAGVFRECVDPDGSTVDNLQREMCRGMNGITAAGQPKMFFDEADQTCKPESHCTTVGYEIAGIDSSGNIVCRKIADPANGYTPNVDPTKFNCTPGMKGRLVYVGNQLRFTCVP